MPTGQLDLPTAYHLWHASPVPRWPVHKGTISLDPTGTAQAISGFTAEWKMLPFTLSTSFPTTETPPSIPCSTYPAAWCSQGSSFKVFPNSIPQHCSFTPSPLRAWVSCAFAFHCDKHGRIRQSSQHADPTHPLALQSQAPSHSFCSSSTTLAMRL